VRRRMRQQTRLVNPKHVARPIRSPSAAAPFAAALQAAG
jgi:hypothetical protein